MFGTLIGSVYPFYLDNVNFSAYYMYRVVSPKLDENLTPLLTFEKIGEKTRMNDFSATDFRMIPSKLHCVKEIVELYLNNFFILYFPILPMLYLGEFTFLCNQQVVRLNVLDVH